MNSYAPDLEAVSCGKHSARPITIIKVEDSRIADEFYALIKSEAPSLWRSMQIHGIHGSDVANAPRFLEAW